MRSLNEELHVRSKNYGTAAGKHAKRIYTSFLAPLNIKEALDYGCGKNLLQKGLNDLKAKIKITPYDPCITLFSTRPERTFEAVICHDVLEHVEPELLDNVLEDIYNYSEKYYFLSIGLGPSNKKLADGRDNHLIQKSSDWWKEQLEKHGFKISQTLETEKAPVNKTVPLYVIICEKTNAKV
jgi:hypothetical protein